MVRVFHGSEVTVYSLDSIKEMTGYEVIMAVTKEEPSSNSVLIRSGGCLPLDKPLSSVKLFEHDVMRVSKREVLPVPVTLDAQQTKIRMREVRDLYRNIIMSHRAGNPNIMENWVKLANSFDLLPAMLREYPTLHLYPKAMSYIADPILLLSTLEDKDNAVRFNSENPILLDVLKGQMTKVINSAGGGGMFGGLPAPVQQQQGAAPQAAPVQGDITADMLRQAIDFAMGRAPAPAAAPAAAPPARAPQQQQDPFFQLRTQYGAASNQLVEFGFPDHHQNLQVLSSVDGNIDQALELLISMRESEQMDH